MLTLDVATGILNHKVDGDIDSLIVSHYFGNKVSTNDKSLTLQSIRRLIARYPELHRIHPGVDEFMRMSATMSVEKLHAFPDDAPAILDRLVLRKNTYVAMSPPDGKVKNINTRIEFYGQFENENIPLSLINPVDVFWTPISIMKASIWVRTVQGPPYVDGTFLSGNDYQPVNEADDPQIRLLELIQVVVNELSLGTSTVSNGLHY